MSDNKTKPTNASVKDYIASRASEEQKADCRTLMALFRKLTKHQPKMWVHKMGRSCLYFKRLGDMDKSTLEQLVVGSIAQVKRRYG